MGEALPAMFSQIRNTLKVLLARRTFERNLDNEIRFHLEMRTRELIAAGFSSREAVRRALLEFGNPEAAQDRCREAFGLRLFDEICGDAQFTLRNLLKDAWLSASVVFTLTLAIATAAGVFGWLASIFTEPCCERMRVPFSLVSRWARPSHSLRFSL